jgi:phosphohistidine phosphatase
MTRAARDRTLVLLRHAEAEHGTGTTDSDRELTVGGSLDAAAAGRWLIEHGIGLDEVLCSPAERAQQTAAHIWSGGCPEADIHLDPRIYDAGAGQLLEVIREADDDADVVMVVGHAPGLPALAERLADGEGSVDGHRAMAEGFPTCGVAVLHYAGPWADLEFGDASLVRFHVARAAEDARTS